MAAKQGLSAQISQASEDAKRAVLSRTSLQTSLWFSNLNTTCTIKSAPPRTPEVLSLLSTKSGWLFKRNEQHVWQTRWCCVVPHTFLYYFDANVLPGEAQPPLPPQVLQEDWNSAVSTGYPNRGGKKKQNAPRSSLYFMGSGGNNANSNHEDPEEACSPTAAAAAAVHPPNAAAHAGGGGGGTPEAFATMQPAGIIDLECYTSVHRSHQNQLILELAGDDAVNPDLRQFYFTAGSESETETWTQALLGQRHTALMDETDAYKQVCDGFAQQLQVLHGDLDNAKTSGEEAQEELYQVRSAMEDGRRSCWKLVEDVLDRHQSNQPGIGDNNSNSNNYSSAPGGISSTCSFRADLNAIRSQDMSLLAPVQLLSDYTRVLEDSCSELQTTNTNLEERLSTAVDSDHDQVSQLQQDLAEAKAELAQQQSQWAHEKHVLTHNLTKSQKELEDLNKDLASTRMEVTMYQSSTRNKIVELQNHKKILKKEVLDLRQKLEDAQSELGLVKHKEKSNRLEVGQERKKAELLERYVDKMESQVKVQQNMMEMMSTSGMGSIQGNGNASQYEISVPHMHSPRDCSSYQPMPTRRNVLLVNTPNIDNSTGAAAGGGGGGGRKDAVSIHDDNDEAIQMPTMGPGGVNISNTRNVGTIGGGIAGSVVKPRSSGNISLTEEIHQQQQQRDQQQQQQKQQQVVEGLPLNRHPSPLVRGRSSNTHNNNNNDDDNKSHMSELTEDRTQKGFDYIHYLRESRDLANNGGVASGVAGAPNTGSSRMLRYAAAGTTPSPQGNRTPPAYILGNDTTNPNVNVSGGASASVGRYGSSSSPQQPSPSPQQAASNNQQQLLQNFQNPDGAKLDTINSRATATTTPNRSSGQSVGRLVLDGHYNHNQNQHHTSSSQSVGGSPGRLSVAQRARLQAERAGSSSSVCLRYDDGQQKHTLHSSQQQPSPQQHQQQQGPPVTSPGFNRMERRPSTSSRSSTGGFFSNIGRKLEAAIDKSVFSVDVRHSDDDDDDDDLSSEGSVSRDPADPVVNRNDYYDTDEDRNGLDHTPSSRRASASLTQESLDGHNTATRQSKKIISPRNSFSRRSNEYESAASSVLSDEKKTSTTPDRNTPRMSLAERSALQKANRLQFLKDQGLIKDEETGSVASTNISGAAASSASFPISSTPRSHLMR